MRSKGHWVQKCKKSFFSRISSLKYGSMYVKQRPKWSVAHSTHIVVVWSYRHASAAKILRFVIFVCPSVCYIS